MPFWSGGQLERDLTLMSAITANIVYFWKKMADTLNTDTDKYFDAPGDPNCSESELHRNDTERRTG